MDDDMEEYSDGDIEEIEEKALAELKSGKVAVKNSDGTLRCPYSPSRKKQAYPYKDLLQHADGVSKGKRGPEAAGKHSALLKYLRADLAGMAAPPVERVSKLDLKAPKRKEAEDLLVWPWCGVVYNIDNRTKNKGLNVGAGVADLKEYFSCFNPDKVHVFWGPRGHLGMGVVTFRRDLLGLKDGQAFENYFIKKEHGRRDWEKRRRDPGRDFYGWLAREEDYTGRGDDYLMAKYLRDNGDLKDVGMVGEEMKKIHAERFNSLAESVTEKDREFQNLLTVIEVARRNAEDIRLELEEKHKRELEEVKKRAKQSTEEHKRAMQKHHDDLTASMDGLTKRCKELEEKEQHLQNEADKSRLEQLKNENRWQIDMVSQQAHLQKKHHADQVKLIKKHEEECKKLEEWIQAAKLRLASQQQNEVEHQRRGEVLETEKFKELADSFTLTEGDNRNTKELEDRIKNMESQKLQFEEKLENLQDENDNFNDTINVLTQAQRTANDELEQARKVALKALVRHGSKQSLAEKRMGEIEEGPWKGACQQRYRNHEDGWQVILKTKFSEWEERIKNHSFSPFKTIKVGDDKWEQQVDEDNEQLRALKEDLGDEVYQTVVTALKEIEEYNASGRYPVPVIWNYKMKRRATLEEVISLLMGVIKTLDPKKKKGVKRTAANMS